MQCLPKHTVNSLSQKIFATLLIGGLLPLSGFAKKAEPTRQAFLPPVASINTKLPLHPEQEAKGDDLGAVTLSAVSTPLLKTKNPVEKIDTKVDIHEGEHEFKSVIDIQKVLDEEELNKLWAATVEKNPVIRFSLEKITTPPELRGKKSSQFVNKTLNVLISGATLAAVMAPGGGYYRNMGAMAGGDAIRNVMSGRNVQKGEVLSPTEQIQLASLVDDLKTRLVKSYQDYKTALQSLTELRTITLKNRTLYEAAQKSKNETAILATSHSYYKALLSETNLKHQAMLERIKLERLAGKDAVANLDLALHISPDSITTASSKKIDEKKIAEKRVERKSLEEPFSLPSQAEDPGLTPLSDIESESELAPIPPPYQE